MLSPEHRGYRRRNLVTDVLLLRAAYSGGIVAEDALAERIIAAGLTGVTFEDITSGRVQAEFVLK